MKKNTVRRRPSKVVNLLFLLVGMLCFVYYFANGFLIRFGQSLLWLWPLIGTALLMRFALVARMIRTGRPSPLPRGFLRVIHVLVAVGLVILFAVEGIIIKGALEPTPAGLDCIIVLGAKVNGTSPSGALRNRIEVAAEYALANPDTLVIASGGQGEDEGISEAECIRRGLVARGVPEERILLESLSTSTRENLRFSLEKLENPNELSIGVVTNNFHVFRAMKIARSLHNGETYAVPVATSLFSLPHYLLREFFATCVGFVTDAW